MTLLSRIASASSAARDVARLVTGTAALAAAVPVVVGADLLGETASLTRSAARAGVRGSLHLARGAAVGSTRVVGTLVTGADPIPGGHLHDLVDATKSMFEPPSARSTRRVYRDRDHLQIELAADDESPGATQSLRRHLERLEGVQ